MKPELGKAPAKLWELFDEIEQVLADSGPPCDVPQSLWRAREEAVLWLVSFDMAMCHTPKRARPDTEAMTRTA